MGREDSGRFWQFAAGFYDRFMKKNQKMFRQLCDCMSPELNKKMNVLELACGTGQLSFALAPRVRLWEATDFSSKMIQEAKGKGRLRNLYFSVQDATKLPYAPETFDAVVIANALHVIPNPETVMREIHKILKPDGILFAPTFVYIKGDERSGLKGRLMERAGFKTFHKWNAGEYISFFSEHGFCPAHHQLLPGNQLTECYVLARKSSRTN